MVNILETLPETIMAEEEFGRNDESIILKAISVI